MQGLCLDVYPEKMVPSDTLSNNVGTIAGNDFGITFGDNMLNKSFA